MNTPEKHPLPHPPPRPADGHKGTFGTVIVVGGCPTMIGAPALAARSALRSGAGLVKAACTSDILPHVLTIEPSATGIALDADADPDTDATQRLRAIDQADPDEKAVLAVGPGMGGASGVWPAVQALLATARPTVLDADGLNALAASRQQLDRPATTVLTPHPGEFRRLAEAAEITQDPTDLSQRPNAAARLAGHHGCVVLLKGRHTVVSDGTRSFINQTGNPALATAGSGDVLTGLIAGLIAQGMDAFDAACLGAHVHGAAADTWAETHGSSGIRAMDLADALPAAMQAYRDGPR